MSISSRASWKNEEGSETKDTKVSLEHPTPRTGDDIVQPLTKVKYLLILLFLVKILLFGYVLMCSSSDLLQ